MLPSSTQALLLALRLRGTALSHDRTIAKQKTGWHKGKWQNGSYCYWYNNTNRREFFFLEVGRKTNVSDALKTKEGEFSP